MYIGQEILLVSPVTVVLRLLELIREIHFWNSIAFSLLRIAGGFILALLISVLLGSVSTRFHRIREFLTPLVLTAKTIPVASFVVLILLWISSRNLSVFISFLMVFPILYTSILNGIENTSLKLLEMAVVFRISNWRKIRYIYSFSIAPFFYTACQVALGLCWKAGTAAEIIGIPKGSIGEKLYQSKIYMNSPDLFSWTVVIILISFLFEKGFLFVLRHLVKMLEQKSLQSHRTPHRTFIEPNSRTTTDLKLSDKIQCIHISKSFGEKVVFSDFSAVFPIGKTSVLTGLSGQGKTTLLRLLTGLDVPDTGEIRGITNQKISIVFQEDRLCENLNPIQNIRLVTRQKISAEEIQKTMARINLTGCENQPVREFSGGMRRRVALLRALYADFDILLLDEPFKGIDYQTIEKTVQLILERTKGKTVIMISHEKLPDMLKADHEIQISLH